MLKSEVNRLPHLGTGGHSFCANQVPTMCLVLALSLRVPCPCSGHLSCLRFYELDTRRPLLASPHLQS